MTDKNLQKYENWKTITESDYVTMFIKTWFAFVATLRELYPDVLVFDESGKPRGDRPFTNRYKQDHLHFISKNLEIKKFTDLLYDLYLPSRINIAKVFPQYFFKSFYRMNENFHYQYTATEYIDSSKAAIKDRVHIDMNIVDRYNIHGVIQTTGKYNQVTYNEQLKFKVDVKKFIDEVDYSRRENLHESEYLKSIYASICNQIDIEINKKCAALQVSSLQDKVKILISSKILFCSNLIRENFKINLEMPLLHQDKKENEYRLIIQQPFNLFSEFLIAEKSQAQMDYCYKRIREDGASWFIDFVIGLRNALFHEIIDPLDALWQKTFKAAYLLLKEFLDLNINYLKLLTNTKSKLIDYINARIDNREIKIGNDDTFLNAVDIKENIFDGINIILKGVFITSEKSLINFEAFLKDNFEIQQINILS